MRHIGIDLDGEIVATVWNNHNSQECNERANLIVRAVSAYEELVNALEIAEGFISTFEGSSTQEGIDYLLGSIRGALALAKPKGGPNP